MLKCLLLWLLRMAIIALAVLGYGAVTAPSAELRDLQHLAELRTAHAWKHNPGANAVDPDQFRYIE